MGIHFIHVRVNGPHPLPIVLTHGWPSTLLEELEILPLLADPAGMVVRAGRPAPTATLLPAAGGGQAGDALRRYDDNRNGSITCAEARAHGIAPVRGGHPAYPFMDDRDNDGVVCG